MNKSNPIRILHVLAAMNRAGAETMLMNLYINIDRERIQFDFAVYTHEHCDYDDEIEALGGKIIRYPKYTVKNHFAYKKWWDDFFRNHHEYRIVHGHIGSTASIFLRIAKRYGCYTIAHSHSTGAGFGLHKILHKAYTFSTRYIADYFMGCSTEALVARYGKKVAGNHDISFILKNAIDVEKYIYSNDVRKEVLDELGLSEDSLIIGTVGRLIPVKNPFFILDMLKELHEIMPSFKFLWVGTGELIEDIKRGIEDRNLQENVILLGVRSDIPRIIQVLNVFILPSKYEGLPVVGVEAQAAGVPVLCSDKVSSEVKLSDCVTFLPINSVKPWVQALYNERTYRRVEHAADDVIKNGYDIKTTSRWLTEFYEKHYSV